MKYDGTLPVWERIIAGLGPNGARHRDDVVGPVSSTQDGIAGSLGLTRSHVAVVLKGLIGRGMVEVRLQHVNGTDRRRMVYYLTELGSRHYQELAASVDVPLGTLVFAPAGKCVRRRDPIEEIARMRIQLDDMEARYQAQQKAQAAVQED